ncbi:MAG: glycosyltransferase family 4 protein [Methylobacter sp.]
MDNAIRSIDKKAMIAIPCLLRGGTEQQTLMLVKALVEMGYRVGLACYFEYDETMVTDFKLAGADVFLLNWPRGGIGAMKFVRQLSAVFREKSPDVVHIQYMAPGLLPIIAAKYAGVPVVLATVHYPGTPHGFVAHLLLRFGAHLTDCFTCVSEAAEKSWFGDSFLLNPSNSDNLISRRHLTIPNAVDIAAIDKAFTEKTQDISEIAKRFKGKTVIGAVARLSSEKGADILLKAFAVARKTMPDVHLLIVGDGPQKDYLQKLTIDLGIANACTWSGRLPWNTAMRYLSMMDIVVVPSRFEGFGLTAIEAMACRKPVIASHVDGLAEIINDTLNGFLRPSENIKSFADCIVELVKDEKKRKSIGEAARNCVEKKYAYPMFRVRIRALYEAVERRTEDRGRRSEIRGLKVIRKR